MSQFWLSPETSGVTFEPVLGHFISLHVLVELGERPILKTAGVSKDCCSKLPSESRPIATLAHPQHPAVKLALIGGLGSKKSA